MSSTAPRIAVVDEDNRFLRWEARRTIHEQRLVHRSIHILVFKPDNTLIIQKRHRDKQTFPGYWENTSGHVEEVDYPRGPDDDLEAVYAATAARELTEELGISAPLERLAAFSPKAGLHYEQIRLYRAQHPGPFTPQAEEVEAIQAVSSQDFDAMRDDPEIDFTPILLFFVDWMRQHHRW